MDLVRKSARGKNPVMHKNNNKGAELAGEMLAGSAFSVYANNEPKPALARDLGRLSRLQGETREACFHLFHFTGNADGTFYETRQDNRQNSSE